MDFENKKVLRTGSESVEDGYIYMVDVDRVAKDGYGGHDGDSDMYFFKSLEEAKTAYEDKIWYWKVQPDRPRIIALSVYDAEFDMWDGIESELVE